MATCHPARRPGSLTFPLERINEIEARLKSLEAAAEYWRAKKQPAEYVRQARWCKKHKSESCVRMRE